MGLEKVAMNLAKYAEKCGVKSILQTKPIAAAEFKAIDFAKLEFKPLTSDTIQIGKSKFTPLEQDLMDSIRHSKVENAHIIDENGVHLKEIKFIGDETSTRIDSEMFLRPDFHELASRMKNASFIHNHTFKAPLSPDDFYYMALNKYKKMIACSPDDCYSFLERTDNWGKKKHELFKKVSHNLIQDEEAEIKRLAYIRGITDIERMNRLSDWRYERFGKVANDFGLKFESKMDKLTELDSIPANAFRLNPVQRFIDKMILFKKSIFQVKS